MSTDRFTDIAARLLIVATTAGILFTSIHSAVGELPLPATAQSRPVAIVAKQAPAPTRLTKAAAAAPHG